MIFSKYVKTAYYQYVGTTVSSKTPKVVCICCR